LNIAVTEKNAKTNGNFTKLPQVSSVSTAQPARSKFKRADVSLEPLNDEPASSFKGTSGFMFGRSSCPFVELGGLCAIDPAFIQAQILSAQILRHRNAFWGEQRHCSLAAI
jgi:hypothetical protein